MRWSAKTARDRFTVVRDRLIALDARRRLWVWRHPRPVAAMIALLCLLALQSRMNLYEIVARRMLLPDLSCPVGRATDRAAVERGAGGYKPGTEYPAVEQIIAELQV